MGVIYHPRNKGGDDADQSNDCTGKSPPVAAGASDSDQAGGSGNEKAEIVCVGCDDAGGRQDGDRRMASLSSSPRQRMKRKHAPVMTVEESNRSE
jgi:hypothetical protein